MKWTLEERNNGSSGHLDCKEKKKRVKLYSRRKVMCIAFFHAMKHMSLVNYEQIFTSIKEREKVRENTTKTSAYVKQKGLGEILRNHSHWITLTNEALRIPEVKTALELQ